jgi:plasmid stabilization system protein ParE
VVIVWENKTKEELKKAYQYILKDSHQNGVKVRDEIINATLSLLKYPERYPLDKYKRDNDGTWRAFELHHYRISYRLTEKQIRIVRFRHTSRSPQLY